MRIMVLASWELFGELGKIINYVRCKLVTVITVTQYLRHMRTFYYGNFSEFLFLALGRRCRREEVGTEKWTRKVTC